MTSPTTSIRPPTPSRAQRRGGALVRRQAAAPASLSTAIRFRSSGIERSPLRRPASTCATGTPAARRLGAGERRVRVAVDEHPVGPLALDGAADRRAASRRVGGVQVEPVRAARAARAPRRRPSDISASQCWPVWRTTSSMPASRSATDTGPDLMNCGRLPTTERTRTNAGYNGRRFGPLAQLAEQGTLNPKVGGSIPPRPTPHLVHRAPAARWATSASNGSRGETISLCPRGPPSSCIERDRSFDGTAVTTRLPRRVSSRSRSAPTT